VNNVLMMINHKNSVTSNLKNLFPKHLAQKRILLFLARAQPSVI